MNLINRSKIFRSLFISIVFFGLIPTSNAQLKFINAADSLGVNFNYGLGSVWHGAAFGGGVSFFDFNKDGWDDLTFSSNANDSIFFFRNDSGTFVKISALVPFTAETKQINWVDIDNDNDYDLFVTSVDSGNRLYENVGNLVMVDITVSSLIGTTNYKSFTANWGDYNKDGYLDLYISNYLLDTNVSNILYRNNGDNSFTDVTKAVGIYDTSTFSMASAFLDYNKDGWPDIYTTSDFTNQPNLLFRNDGNNKFTDVTSTSKTDPKIDAMSATIEDYNNDGQLDIYVTNTPSPGNILYHNLGNGVFSDTSVAAGVSMNAWAWGACFMDAENDGDMDLYVSSSSMLSLNSAFFKNGGIGIFTKPTGIGFLGDSVQSYGNAVGDFNNDGLADIAVNNQLAKAFLWTNKGGGKNYLKVLLKGYLTNKDGIGSFIFLYSSNGMQMKYTMNGEGLVGQNSQYEIFGLDTTTIVDSIKVEWLSGHKETLYNINANQTITIKEGETNAITASILADDSLISSKLIRICKGDSITLSAQIRFDHVLWSTGDTTLTIKVGSPGIYYLTASVGKGKSSIDSIELQLIDLSSFSIGPKDTTFCPGGKLKSNISADQYLWNDNGTTKSKNVFTSGTYWLKITKSFCSITDTVKVSVFNVDDMTLGNDTTICKGQSLELDPGDQWINYVWSDNSTGKTLMVNDTVVEYSVLVTDANGCTKFDKILVKTVFCTGIETWNNSSFFEVFPNPANDIIVIENSSDNNWQFRFINTAGQQVKSGKISNDRVEIDVSGLPSGSYSLFFVNEENDDVVEIKKVLIYR